MKKSKVIRLLCAIGLLCAAIITVSLWTGCQTTTTINPDGTTNTVKYVDPVRLQQAKDALEPAASSVLRRAIIRSPEHAKEIGDYARAVGTVFKQMAVNKNFTPEYLIDAANKATMTLQATAPPEVIDAKNAAVALYKIFLSDQLMVALPANKWQLAICQLFYESVDQALKDAGQPGI